MNPSTLTQSFALPFLVTLAGVGTLALAGSCDTVTQCQVKTFALGYIALFVIPVTSFVAGRVSSSSLIGLAAIAAGALVVVGFYVAADLGYTPPYPIPPSDPVERISANSGGVVVGAGAVFILLLPGFFIGRWRREIVRSRPQRAEVARIEAQRAAGTITSDEFARQMTLLGAKMSSDQAPPDHQCGRCGKPLSPVWHGYCKHCGAPYMEYPPVPRVPSANQ